jgi:uncharacterized protein
MLTAAHILILLAVGAAAGFSGALLGVGGGFIMVPISYWVVLAMGVAEKSALMIAFGTSFLVMLPTAISGAWRHNRNGAVHWRLALVLGSCALLGALVGAALAARLPADVLKRGFGVLVLAIALWMGVGVMPRSAGGAREPRENLRLIAACGFPIGIVTGLTGLGGGALIVPMLVLVFRYPMHTAVGTSVASIVLTSVGGIVGYVVNGLGVPDLLPHSVGYINIPIWLCLVATSIPLAQLGARTAHALPTRPLRFLFIGFMIYTGLRMIGVF